MPVSSETIEDICRRFQKVKTQRQTLDSTWEEIALNFRPERIGFTSSPTPGEDLTGHLYDSEPLNVVRELSASIEALMMPPQELWARVEAENPGKEEPEDEELDSWLDEHSKVLSDYIYADRAQFQRSTSVLFPDLVTFGAGGIYIGESADMTGLMFWPIDLGCCWWMRDHAGNLDTVFYWREMSIRQAAQVFGKDNLSEESRKALDLDKSSDDKIKVLHVVMPRREASGMKATSGDMPFASLHVEHASKHVLREGGFQEMPYVLPEYSPLANGDLWSPAREALPDAGMLQEMGRTIIRKAQKTVDPPKAVPSEGIIGPLNTFAGGVTIYDPTALSRMQGGQQLVQALEPAGDIGLGLDMQQETRAKIGRTFLRHVLSLPVEGPQMTATEVLRRSQDLVRLTAALFDRMQASLQRPIVLRCWNILWRWSWERGFDKTRGAPFREPPPSLLSRQIRFKFLSPITRARREAEIASLAQTMESLILLFKARPEALENIDADEITRDVVATALSPKYLLPKDVVEAARDARARQEQQMMQLAVAREAAGAMKDVTPAAKLLEGAPT